MDKKSILIGIFLLVTAFGMMMWNAAREQEARAERLRQAQEEERERAAREPDPEIAPGEPRTVRPDPADPAETFFRRIEETREAIEDPDTLPLEAPAEEKVREERLHTLENDFMRVHFNRRGGAVEFVELKNYKEDIDDPSPFVLNRDARQPALAIGRETRAGFEPFAPRYEVAEMSDSHIVFKAKLPNGIVVERRYEITFEDRDAKPYTIRYATRFINETDTAFTLDRLSLVVGTAVPTEADPWGFNLNASLSDGGRYRAIPASRFTEGGFLFFRSSAREQVEREGRVIWAAVKNQFFTTIVTPDEPGEAVLARGEPALHGRDDSAKGVTASVRFLIPTIDPGSMREISGEFYAGPKTFKRLSRMDQGQEDVMQLGWFLGLYLSVIAFIAKILLTMMNGIHGLLGNWGLAIILTTIIIRFLMWPLTAKAAKTSKRMQKLQGPMKELREKYKDDQRKLNEEMMKMWKKHKINPLAGCLPVLVQMPIFISFFNLIRGSADLRFADFLLVNDLSMPDRLISFGDATLPLVGNSLNILPFIWLVTMWYQMKLMPQPSVDNAQVKIFKFMPFVFFPFTYIFSSGLVLYWTTSNCFSIFQQIMTNRKRDEEDIAIEEEIKEKEEKKTVPSGPLLKKKKKKKPGNDPRNRMR